MNDFRRRFGAHPDAVEAAPGRVNLLGEHTDYSEGYVLPTAIPQKTTVSVRSNGLNRFRAYSVDLNEAADFTVEASPRQHYALYIYGCIKELVLRGVRVPPLDIHVVSSVPIGVGLSSSAALEVAVLRALRRLLRLDLDDVEIAKLAQRAETGYAGVNCGLLDQMASSLLSEGCMLFLDTRTLDRRLLPLPHGSEILVIDSGVARSLAFSEYNKRRAECEAAARALGIAQLRDATDLRVTESLPDMLRRRAQHVISENARVLRAVSGVSPTEFGRLMNESHTSLRDLFEVSTPVLDELVALMKAESGVYGAKLTGAGFGGACVALCEPGRAAGAGARIVQKYNNRGYRGQVLVPSGI